MRMAVLDGGAFSSREELHAGLAQSLQLPCLPPQPFMKQAAIFWALT